MGLTSGGIFSKGRRKRNKAARLHPIAEDAASTIQLFDGMHRRTNGRVRGAALPAPPTPDRPGADDPGAPRLRYEWRSASGEVLVVEAGLPEPARPPSPPTVPLRGVPRPATDGLDLRH